MDFGIYIISRSVRAIQEVTDRCYRRIYKKRTNVNVFSLSNNMLISFCDEALVTHFVYHSFFIFSIHGLFSGTFLKH